jgi:hypothetical protein
MKLDYQVGLGLTHLDFRPPPAEVLISTNAFGDVI